MPKDAGFEILMLGACRAGKSSVLSAMLKSIEKTGQRTGFSFQADADTQQVMRSKLSDLEKLYVMHAGDPDIPFSTLLGEEGGEAYSAMTESATPYCFKFSIQEKKKTVSYTVRFTDIPGEHMVRTPKGDSSVVERFIKSHVVIIAVDSPALMEGKVKEGVGEFHKSVNVPDSVREVIQAADCRMREKLGPQEVMAPKMILFVPLKCEKYYHAHAMDELNQRVKLGYRQVFSYLERCPEYTVAITPILTLGDIVFDHYVRQDNKKKMAKLDGHGAGGMANMPALPMYRIRSPECTTINPRYCEQPLLYLAGYIMGMQDYLKRAQTKVEEDEAKHTVLGKIKGIAKHTFFFALFGIYYFAFVGILKLFQDQTFMKIIGRFCQSIKISGDGYEIVQDSLGIRKIVESCAGKNEKESGK